MSRQLKRLFWISSLLIIFGCAYRSPDKHENRPNDTVLVTIHDTVTHIDTVTAYCSGTDSVFQEIEIEQTCEDIEHIHSDLDTILEYLDRRIK